MISVLILTWNEESVIRQCLASVAWSDDIVVVDSFSTDQTVTLARDAGARVVQHPFINFTEQRNFGLREGGLRHEWVLHLDADEVVTPALRDELLRTVAAARYPAYRVASQLIFQGRWIRRASMYPCYQVRLGRRDELQFVQVGHGQRENLPPDRIGTLREPLLHHSFAKGLEDWFAKHNRYSTAEAEENLRSLTQGGMRWGDFFARDPVTRWRALKELSMRLPCRPTLRFLYVYFGRLGFLDGVAGWRYCRLLSIYESMIVLKMKERAPLPDSRD